MRRAKTGTPGQTSFFAPTASTVYTLGDDGRLQGWSVSRNLLPTWYDSARLDAAEGRISVGGALLFASGKDELLAASFETLERIAQVMRETSPEARFVVHGHTDDVGPEAENLDLSARRAARVSQYLEAAGIDATRLRSIGHGETQAVATNATEAGRRVNRRVVFEVEGTIATAP